MGFQSLGIESRDPCATVGGIISTPLSPRWHSVSSKAPELSGDGAHGSERSVSAGCYECSWGTCATAELLRRE